MTEGNKHPIRLNRMDEREKAQRLLDELKRRIEEKRKKGETLTGKIGSATYETTNPEYVERLKYYIEND